jgi:hypothetical protein
MHIYREVAQDVVGHSYKSILLIDPCNAGPFRDYLNNSKGELASPDVLDIVEGISLRKSCWASGLCLSWPQDLVLCSVPVSYYEAGGPGEKLINHPSYDVLVHGFQFTPNNLNSSVPALRTW